MPTRQRIESPFGASGPVGAERAERAATSATLALRALTGFEEEHVERHASEPNTARLCNEIIARCLVAPGEDPGAARTTVRELLVAERDRELVALRRLSLGPHVTALVACPRCGEECEASFSLDVLPLHFDVPERQVLVDVEGVGDVVLRLPTAGDQEDLFDAGLDGEAERRSWLLARCLERYGDQSGGFDLRFAHALPVAVRGALEAALEERLPDLDLQMAVECSRCGAAISAPFDVPVFFFSS
ncbi:MAG: hypothetical protein QOJ63_1041 [Solirubrobacteraceae bacterium]|jgi:hypothetical protein|nr:hypothetical protein [Solirubrobacteraceae bacterium]